MVTQGNFLIVLFLTLTSQMQDSVGRSAYKRISQSISKEEVRSAIVPINPQDLQGKNDEGIDKRRGDVTPDDMQHMSPRDGFSPETDLKQDLDTMKSGNVKSAEMRQLNPFETSSWDSNNDQNQRNYERLYENDPLPEYRFKENNYSTSAEATHQDSVPLESYASIEDLREKYKSHGEASETLLGSHNIDQHENQYTATIGGEKHGHSDLVTEIGKEVLLKLLGHNNTTDSNNDESERRVLFDKLLGMKPSIQGFSSGEVSASKAALQATSAHQANVTQGQGVMANTATAGKVSGKVMSDAAQGKETLVETNQSSQHQVAEQANGDSRQSALKGNKKANQPQTIQPNLEIEENVSTKIRTESASEGPTPEEGRDGNNLVTLRISGAGKPVSFKADTNNDGSLLLKIPGNVKLMDAKIGKEDIVQVDSRSSQVDGDSALRQTSAVSDKSSVVSNVNISKDVDSATNTGETSRPASQSNNKNLANSSGGTSYQESANQKRPSQEQTDKLTDKSPEALLQISGSKGTVSLLRKQLTGPSDWQILGKTSENIQEAYQHNPLRDDQDNDDESIEENPKRVQDHYFLQNSVGRKSNGKSRQRLAHNYTPTVLAVNVPSFLSTRISEQRRPSNRMNSAFEGWNAMPAYTSNLRQTSSFTRGANGIIQPNNDDNTKMDILRLVDLARIQMAKLRQKNVYNRSEQYGSSSDRSPLNDISGPTKYSEANGVARGMVDSPVTDGEKRYQIGDSHISKGFSMHTDNWSTWSPCSITCGHGIQARARLCEGTGCEGYRTESKSCIRDLCPEELGQAGLRLHNKFRAWHKSAPLEWSKKLAKKAQNIANKLASEENLLDSDLEGTKGENIAELKQNYNIAAEKATAEWYSEVKNFGFKEPRLGDQTSHFTQLIWKDSKRLGMGTAKSRDGTHTIVVAFYDPPGNIESEVKENVQMPNESNKRDMIIFETLPSTV